MPIHAPLQIACLPNKEFGELDYKVLYFHQFISQFPSNHHSIPFRPSNVLTPLFSDTFDFSGQVSTTMKAKP